MPASYEDLLDQFFTNYSHHFTPSGQPHKVDPKAYLEAEKMRRAGAMTQGDAAKAFVNKARAERGLPPVGESGNVVPQGQNGMSRDQLEVLAALQAMANPKEDGGPSAADYAKAVPGVAIAAYNNNMPRLFGPHATIGTLTGQHGNVIDQTADSFNRVLDHVAPYEARSAFNKAVDAAGHASAAMIPYAHGAPAVNIQARAYNPPIAKPLASIERDFADNAALQARMEAERRARRGPGLGAEVEIRTQGGMPSSQDLPATSPVQLSRPGSQPELSELRKTATAPQSNATSAGNASATPGPRTPVPSPPPSPDLQDNLTQIQRAYRTRALEPPQFPIDPKRFPTIRLAEEPQFGEPPNAFADVPDKRLVSDGNGGQFLPVPYGRAHRAVAQPMIAKTMEMSGSVPDALALNNAFEAANILPVNPRLLDRRLSTIHGEVDMMRLNGATDQQIASNLRKIMLDPTAYGFKPSELPAIIGTTIGAASALSQAEEQNHHSNYQPRGTDGTFSGPPSRDWKSNEGGQ